MIIAADNINPMNPAVAAAVEKLDPLPIRDIVCRIERNGARFIDINPGYLSKRKIDRMKFLVETVQEASSLRLILDSPDAEVLRAGLNSCNKNPILNGLTMEPHKLDTILPLAKEADADLVLLMLDEKSMCPHDLDAKIALAVELRERAVSAGLTDEKLIFDPVMPNLSWPDALKHSGECIRAVRMISSGALFGMPAKTMIGLSNLLSGVNNPEKNNIEKSLLLMLAGAGLDIALMNVLNCDLIETLRFFSQF